MIETAFWLSATLILYTYFGYPLLLIAISGIRQAYLDTTYVLNRTDRRTAPVLELPTVTVVVSAFNEESCIGDRIANLLAADYPPDKLRVLVGSDGSTDRTAEILGGVSDPRLVTKVFSTNRGKISVLNDLVQQADSELLVMTDANTVYDTDTIKMLVRHFFDPRVGAVCGELHLVDLESGLNQDSAYWRYEQVLKFHESRIGGLLGANGAVYAIRRSLYEPLPTDTIIDDFQIVMNVSKQGYMVKYDPESKASETVAPNLAAEHGRRVRIGAGNFQSISRVKWALNPLVGSRSLSFLSHKLLRWFVPHLMIIALLTNALLVSSPFYLTTLAGQVLFYAIAVYGLLRLRSNRLNPSFVSIPAFFVAMNFALLLGFFRFLRSDLRGSWNATEREQEL